MSDVALPLDAVREQLVVGHRSRRAHRARRRRLATGDAGRGGRDSSAAERVRLLAVDGVLDVVAAANDASAGPARGCEVAAVTLLARLQRGDASVASTTPHSRGRTRLVFRRRGRCFRSRRAGRARCRRMADGGGDADRVSRSVAGSRWARCAVAPRCRSISRCPTCSKPPHGRCGRARRCASRCPSRPRTRRRDCATGWRRWSSRRSEAFRSSTRSMCGRRR